VHGNRAAERQYSVAELSVRDWRKAEATLQTLPLRKQVSPQQGDPLGSLLFCLPLQPILQSLFSALMLGYLDDISLGGATPMGAEDVK